MKILRYAIFSLILTALAAPGFCEAGKHSLGLYGGASLPLGSQGKRADPYLPYFSASYRYASEEYSRYLAFDLEAGFFAVRSKTELAGKLTTLYSEPVTAGALGLIPVGKDTMILPRFGVGMMFNQASGAASGSYNHVLCSLGVGLSRKMSELVSLNIRFSAFFGLDKNRVIYHIVPDIGATFHL